MSDQIDELRKELKEMKNSMVTTNDLEEKLDKKQDKEVKKDDNGDYDLEAEEVTEVEMSQDIVKQSIWLAYVMYAKRKIADKRYHIPIWYQLFITITAISVTVLQFSLVHRINTAEDDQPILNLPDLEVDKKPSMALCHLTCIIMISIITAQDLHQSWWAILMSFGCLMDADSKLSLIWNTLNFLMSLFQVIISMYLQIVCYKLIVSTNDVVDVMKDFAALVVINEFDDIVGSFLKPFFKSYSSFMMIKTANAEAQQRLTLVFQSITISLWIVSLSIMLGFYSTENHTDYTSLAFFWMVPVILVTCCCSCSISSCLIGQDKLKQAGFCVDEQDDEHETLLGDTSTKVNESDSNSSY